MAKLEIVYADNKPVRYIFYCPGCKMSHWFWTKEVNEGPSPHWEIKNNTAGHETVDPSIKVQYGIGKICHLNITDGKIIYHDDGTTHELAGKTVDLVEI